MPRESTIQVYRSTTTDIPTGLTFGEIAYSTVNNRVFIGDATGNSIWVGAGVTTGTIATNSSVLIPTQSAVKTYVDSIVGGGSVVNSINGTGGNITITGDSGSQQVSVSGTTTTITNRLATASLTGVASFPLADFAVSNGSVSLTGNVARKNIDNSFTSPQTIVSSNTSTQYGHASISSSFSLNSYTISTPDASANIWFPIQSGTLALQEFTVSSLNGLTGARTLTGDGGAMRGVAGTAITARLATSGATGVASFDSNNFTVSAAGAVALRGAVTSINGSTGAYVLPVASASVTGVASFPAADFAVSALGAVSLTANVARTNIAQTFTGTQTFAATARFTNGLSADDIFVGLTGATFGEFAYRLLDDQIGSSPRVILKSNQASGLLLYSTGGGTASSIRVNALGTNVEHQGPNPTLTVTHLSDNDTGALLSVPNNFTSRLALVATDPTATSTTILNAAPANLTQAAFSITLPGDNGIVALTKNVVSSLNGLTGARTLTGDGGAMRGVAGTAITARVASASVTGVASFDSNNFTVSAAGAVALRGAATSVNGATGAISITGDGGSQLVSISGTTTTITNRIATTGVTGVASFDTNNFSITAGAVSLKGGGVPNTALVNSSFTLRDEVGGTDTISLGDTLTITGGRGVDFIRTTTDTYEVRGITATSSVLGVASFDSNNFTVTNGAVALRGAVTSVNGATGAYVLPVASASVTGVASFDSNNFTVSAAGAVALRGAVTSVNGATGAISVTGDGGSQIVSISGTTTTITNRVATTGVTGVASFDTNNFSITAGAVSLKGGGVPNTALANSSITVFANASNTINLGGTLTITGTANQVAVSSSSGTVTLGLPNDITIPGNLTVNGTVVTANVNNFVVEDPLFMLGTGNGADSVDLGFYGQYVSTGTRYAGLFRDASDGGKFKLFAGLTAEPTTFVDNSFSSFAVATLVAKVDGGTF